MCTVRNEQPRLTPHQEGDKSVSPPPKQRRAIKVRGRPRNDDIARSLRDCIGVQCRDKPDRSFLSNGPGNRLCADCADFAARNGGAIV